MLPAMPDVPMPVAIGFGLACLGAGAIVTAIIVRDKLATARRLASRAATLDVRTETLLHRVEAITSPTQGMPLVQLVAATQTPAERLAAGWADLTERVRDAIIPTTGHTRDWAPGEMTAAFRKLVDDTPDWELPTPTEVALVDGLPANQPVVHPLRPTRPAPAHTPAPAIVRAPAGPQAAPRWQDLPAPPRRAVSRGAMALQGLRARGRDWRTVLGGMEIELPPVMDPPPFPEPFRMPAQRLPHDPRRMASLPQDPTRQWRTRRAAA